MTQKLTSRQKYMLHLIVESEGVSTDELVRRLEVSRRTIQRDLQALEGYLQKFKVELSTTDKGLVLSGNKGQLSRALAELGKLPRTLALTPKDRAFYVAVELLLNEGPLKLSYLAKKLGVTSASISHDLDQVADWLRSRGLRLTRRRGYGVEVSGNEAMRLESIAELVYEQLPMHQLMVLFRREQERDTSLLHTWFIDWFSVRRLEDVRMVLSEELASLNPPLDEAAFYGFMLHVMLTCMRIERDAHLPAEPETAVSTVDTELCRRILHRLVTTATDIEGEVQYLAKHLRGAKVLMTEDSRILPLNITAMDLAYKLAQHLCRELHLPLTDDRDLLLGLAQHLEPAIYRMRTGLVIRNPLLEEIRRRYGQFFGAMRKASEQVLEPLGLTVPDAEIGYLTMHLGAAMERRKAGSTWRAKIVCPNGISSAELLASRMHNEFPQVRIVSVEAVHSLNDTDCDFIVSTVPVATKLRPTITVSPFLDAVDVEGVQNLLETLEGTFAPAARIYHEPELADSEQPSAFARALSERVVHATLVVDSVSSLIQDIAERAVASGDATDREQLTSAIMERERMGSIVLPGKQFAVLHARTDAMTRCHVAVYHLEPPITMQGVGQSAELVDAVLALFAPVEELSSRIHALGRLSAALVMDEHMVETLRTGSTEEVKSIIYHAMTDIQE